MSDMSIALQRREAEVKHLGDKIASLKRDAAQSIHDHNGMRSQYKVQLREWCLGEAGRLEERITELDQMSDDQLIAAFVPEVQARRATQAADAAPLSDVLRRGAYGIGSEVVSSDLAHTRREGPPVSPVDPIGYRKVMEQA